MRPKRWFAVASAAALLIALAATAATGSTIYTSQLSVTFRSAPSGDRFSGRVSSAKPGCRKRKVIIFRKRSGADDRIRAARSRRGGAWKAVPPHHKVGAGRYYAVIRTKVLRGGSAGYRACAPVKTTDVVVTRH